MGIISNSKKVKIRVLVSTIRRERPQLALNFSKLALTEIAKGEIAKNPRSNNICFLVDRCIASMENQLETTLVDQKKLLQDCLEGDCEYPLEVINEMTPRQKISNWLEWNGICGFTDDILDVVSAAYDIILEPDLNR